MIKSWMVIGGVAILIAMGGSWLSPSDRQWFNRLKRPQWLTFEGAIPLIWTFIFICLAWSAYIIWEGNPGTTTTWLIMGVYLLLEIATISYTSLMCKLRSLQVGTIIGGTGFFVALFLAIAVYRFSSWATILLLPYLLWSPIGTYTTWTMMFLNPDDV
ncbi:TspO/MBR family protein [Calothrix sp. 336/3]|uniref:TspO/MBR family protein n=1 Tax=Calothrix sp. 336/3 TaxID=1337936 RepID=UPI0004E2B54E|nr:TspO/MBR family protein [Calothrix sp. 336/3]AKG22671.1 TspO/MBR-like protein [Calothrix sp. 336/3]